MRWPTLILLIAMTACGASTSAGSHVRTASAPAETFARYRTFGFRQAAGSAATAAPPQLAERRLRSFIAARLILKGYVEQTGGGRPDFVVAFDRAHGALVIDADDTRTAAQVWRAASDVDDESGQEPACIDDDVQLREDVGRVMTTFPVRSDPEGLAEISALTW